MITLPVNNVEMKGCVQICAFLDTRDISFYERIQPTGLPEMVCRGEILLLILPLLHNRTIVASYASIRDYYIILFHTEFSSFSSLDCIHFWRQLIRVTLWVYAVDSKQVSCSNKFLAGFGLRYHHNFERQWFTLAWIICNFWTDGLTK